MFAYVLRRILYAFPILLGINILIFGLFFFVNTPENMARTILGDKRLDQQQIDNWLREHNYHLPSFYNNAERFPGSLTQTIFWQKSMQLFVFDFGKSDTDNVSIGRELLHRIPYSICITIPMLLFGVTINLFVAMIIAFYRGTYIDYAALIICVAMMSVSSLFYIIGGQYIIAIRLKLAPVSGFDTHILYSWKFLVMPIIIGIISGMGASIRYYRTIFLEEINKDYIRTARAKGLGEGAVLFKHALRNAMIPILTNVIVSIPFLIMGSMLLDTLSMRLPNRTSR
jgi:peptide/nickel transport system permease protein